jgi:uncharacterized protein (DUF1330 family)
MPAYIIARVRVTDPNKYEEYKALTPAAIAAGGGKFIARGGRVKTLEGEPEDRRVLVIEFPTFDKAEAFYASAQYQAAKAKREGAAEGQFIIVDGV